jgi:hypothetical protein
MNARHPFGITVVSGLGLPAAEWSLRYSAMLDWLTRTIGNGRHAVQTDAGPGRPDTVRFLLASFADARDFVERFDLPIVPIGEHPWK